MRKWTPAVLIAAGYAFSAAVFGRLPELVVPHWDALFPFAAIAESDAMPRTVAAFGLPTMALVVWLLFAALASPAGERLGRRIFPSWFLSQRTGAAAIDRFEPSFAVIVTSVVAFVILFHVVILGTVLGWPAWTLQVFTAILGLGVTILGNVVPRIRPNWIAGLRTRRTLNDPDLWRRTHRWFGGLLMVTGVAMVAMSLVSPAHAVITGIAGFLISAITAAVVATTDKSTPVAVAVVVAMAGILAVPPVLPAQASPPAGFVERPIDIPSGTLVLLGTLALPRDTNSRMPIAVIVAGSGPTDRNGNGPLVQTDLYAQLARALAERGIATVRYDKRGIGESARTIDHSALMLDDYVNDVLAVTRAVASDGRYSRIFLIGHSEGAGLVLQAANRGAPVEGVAMLSGIGRKLQHVLHDQFALQTDSATVTKIDSAFARFIRGEDVPDAPPIAAPVLVPGYRRLIASMAAYDPTVEIAGARVAVLIVQGAMDVQVDLRDAEALHAARPDATYLTIPAANHVFKAATSRDLTLQRPLYQDRTIPIVPELAQGIAAWIGKSTHNGSAHP